MIQVLERTSRVLELMSRDGPMALRDIAAETGLKKTTLSKFIYALGIRHVGEHIAQLLATHFGGFERLQGASREALSSVSGIGGEIADSVVSYFADASNSRNVNHLFEAGIHFKTLSPPPASPVHGKAFALTGTLHAMTRSEARDRILRQGGRFASSVSASTDYLVVGKSPGSKLQKARELDITILQEEEFLQLLGEEWKLIMRFSVLRFFLLESTA